MIRFFLFYTIRSNSLQIKISLDEKGYWSDSRTPWLKSLISIIFVLFTKAEFIDKGSAGRKPLENQESRIVLLSIYQNQNTIFSTTHWCDSLVFKLKILFYLKAIFVKKIYFADFFFFNGFSSISPCVSKISVQS